MRLCFQQESTWPCLAWVAECSGKQVAVRHGNNVETNADWFGECIWDGKYTDGDLDRAEHVFGSGARVRDGEVIFVASSSVLDRLHWIADDDRLVVSNSMTALLALTDSQLPLDASYPSFFRSICKGLDDYQRVLELAAPRVQLHMAYFQNLVWDGGDVRLTPKPHRGRELNSYDEYRSQISHVIRSLSENWSDHHRNTQYTPLSTVSTGYDSTAASAIGKDVGLSESMTIVNSRSGESDDGSLVAEQLGLTCHRIERSAWQSTTFSEVPFIASDAKGEDVYVAGAGDLLSQRVLLTGYGGSRVWGLKEDLCEQFQRGDQSGLSHCEARLVHGYMHLPVPFLVARQPGDLRRISRTTEMEPWHVPGKYNCPLARRIVEEQGVDREAFGMKKKAASVLLYDRTSFLSEESEQDFWDWYGDRFRGTQRLRNYAQHALCGLASNAARFGQVAAHFVGQPLHSRWLNRIAHSSRLSEIASYQPHFRYLFPWAVEKHLQAYR